MRLALLFLSKTNFCWGIGATERRFTRELFLLLELDELVEFSFDCTFILSKITIHEGTFQCTKC